MGPTHLVVLGHAIGHWIFYGTAAQFQIHHPFSSPPTKINHFGQRGKAGSYNIVKNPHYLPVNRDFKQGSLPQNGRFGTFSSVFSSHSFQSISMKSKLRENASVPFLLQLPAPAYPGPHSHQLLLLIRYQLFPTSIINDN